MKSINIERHLRDSNSNNQVVFKELILILTLYIKIRFLPLKTAWNIYKKLDKKVLYELPRF